MTNILSESDLFPPTREGISGISLPEGDVVRPALYNQPVRVKYEGDDGSVGVYRVSEERLADTYTGILRLLPEGVVTISRVSEEELV